MICESKNPRLFRGLKQVKKIATRLEIAALSSEQKTPSEISRLLKISRPTVYLWQRRYEEKGLEALYEDLPRSGRKPSFSIEQKEAVINKASATATCNIHTLAKSMGLSYGITRRILLRNKETSQRIRKTEHQDVNTILKTNKQPNLTQQRLISPLSKKKKTLNPLPSSQPTNPFNITQTDARPITQKEIGKHCRLSQATVSLALNASPLPKTETRLKIQRFAQKNNYIPTPSSASLANLRWHRKSRFTNLAFLAPEGIKTKQKLYLELRNEAKKQGYALELIELNELTRLDELNQRLHKRGIQGIILGAYINESTNLRLKKWLQWERFTALSLHYKINWLNSMAGVDYPKRIKHCIHEILKNNYKRFSFLDLSQANKNPSLARISDWIVGKVAINIESERKLRCDRAPELPPLALQTKNRNQQIAQLSAYLNQYKPELILCDQDAGYSLLQEASQGRAQPAFVSLNKEDKQDKNIAGLMAEERKAEISLIIKCLDKQIRNNEWGLPSTTLNYNFPNAEWKDGLSLPPKTHSKVDLNKDQIETIHRRSISKDLDNDSSRFEVLNLQKAFNRSTGVRGQWFGEASLTLNSGRHEFNQTPFELLKGEKLNRPNAIIMRSSEAKSTELPQTVTLPLTGRYRKCHFLHTCGWASLSQVFASYKFIYHDGSESHIPLLTLKSTNSILRNSEPNNNKPQKPNIGDWYAYYDLHTKELQEDASAFKLAASQIDNRFESYYLFTLHWKNPHPEKSLKALQIQSDINQKTTLAVLGVTLEK